MCAKNDGEVGEGVIKSRGKKWWISGSVIASCGFIHLQFSAQRGGWGGGWGEGLKLKRQSRGAVNLSQPGRLFHLVKIWHSCYEDAQVRTGHGKTDGEVIQQWEYGCAWIYVNLVPTGAEGKRQHSPSSGHTFWGGGAFTFFSLFMLHYCTSVSKEIHISSLEEATLSMQFFLNIVNHNIFTQWACWFQRALVHSCRDCYENEIMRSIRCINGLYLHPVWSFFVTNQRSWFWLLCAPLGGIWRMHFCTVVDVLH